MCKINQPAAGNLTGQSVWTQHSFIIDFSRLAPAVTHLMMVMMVRSEVPQGFQTHTKIKSMPASIQSLFPSTPTAVRAQFFQL